MHTTNHLTSILHSIKRILGLLIAIPTALFLICLPVWLYSYYSRIDLEDRILPPGWMIDIGTHMLHLNCSGEGLPTVVMEAGGSSWSASWTPVTNLLRDIRVCVYDRAGMGWSERGPNPRNAKVIAAELSQLLASAGEKPPYLIVGHSFGGTVALSFLEANLENVAGFVAVETPTYAFMKWRRDTRFIVGGRLRQVAAPFLSVLMTATSVLFPPDMNKTPYSLFSDYEKAAVQDTGFRTRMIATQAREDAYVESIEPVTDFGSLPVVAIQGAASIFSSAEWNKNQQDLLAMSSNGTLLLVDSAGHGVPSQAPQYIVEGINWIRSTMNND